MPDNPVIDFMRSRRSVLAAKMTAPGPSAADLDTMLEIALRVPDHGKIEPWRVQILREEGQRRLGELYAAIVARDPGCRAAQIDAARERLQRSPLLLVVSSHPDRQRGDKIPLIEQRLSAGAVCSHLLIAATALGYAAQWLTGGPAYEPEVREALGHDAETIIAGFIHVGTAVEPPLERPRPDRDRIVSEWPPADA